MFLSGSKSGFREAVFAISASLAIHVGIFLIFFTATAMSTGLKLWEDPVLHVSLISMVPVRESNVFPDTSKTQYHRHEIENTLTEPAVTVSIDKQEKNKIKVAKMLPDVSGGQATQAATPLIIGLSVSEAVEKTKTNSPDYTGRHSQVASSAAMSVPISMAIPRYRDNTQPVYPWIARLRGYEGVVLISAEIHADGQVGNLKLKKSSGFAVLDQSAIEAVKTWKFEPGKKIGRPVSMWVDVPVKFVLKDGTAAM